METNAKIFLADACVLGWLVVAVVVLAPFLDNFLVFRRYIGIGYPLGGGPDGHVRQKLKKLKLICLDE